MSDAFEASNLHHPLGNPRPGEKAAKEGSTDWPELEIEGVKETTPYPVAAVKLLK